MTQGIILACGTGARMYPRAYVLSKQLLSICDRPMIYESVSVLFWWNMGHTSDFNTE